MGGLEEILNQIKADANEEAADILAKAQDTCDSIKENAQIEIDKIETAGTKRLRVKKNYYLVKLSQQPEWKQSRNILKQNKKLFQI